MHENPALAGGAKTPAPYNPTATWADLGQDTPEKIAAYNALGFDTPDNEALQNIKQALQQNYEVRPVTLGSGSEAKVPDDVDAALIIGPNTGYSDDELKAIDEFNYCRYSKKWI